MIHTYTRLYISPAKRLSRLLVVTVCTFIPLAARAQGAAATPSATTDSIDKITLDVAAGAFVQRLPFDVSFFIVGTPPKDAVQVGAVLVDPTPPKDCPKRATGTAKIPDSTQPFAVYIERTLCYDRRYEATITFLKKPDAGQLAGIRTSARKDFDSALQKTSGNLSTALGQELYDKLDAAVEKAAGPTNWARTPEGLFGTKGHTQPLDPFMNAINGVLATQNARAQILRTITDRTATPDLERQLASALGQIEGNAGIAALQAVPASVTSDSAVAPVWTKSKDALDLLKLDPTLVSRGGVSVDMDQAWTDVSDRVTSYQQSLKALQDLQDLLKLVIDTTGLRPKFVNSLNTAQFDALAALQKTNADLLPTAIATTGRLITNTGQLQSRLKERGDALDALVQQISLLAVQEMFVIGSTVVNGDTASSLYISLDGGFLYAPAIGNGFLYLGTNIYTRPINKSAPLSQLGGFRRRFAFNVGLTLNSVADPLNKIRFDFLTSNQSLVTGAGFRVTPSLRIGSGVLIFREANHDPNVTSRRTVTSFYLSASVDMNIAKAIGGANGPFK